MPAEIHIERRDDILVMTLDDPETRNAIARDIYEKATPAVIDAGSDPAVRAIVLTGANGVFCSGGNVGNFPERRKQPRSVSMGSIAQLHRLDQGDPRLSQAGHCGGRAGRCRGRRIARTRLRSDRVVARGALCRRLCQDRPQPGWRRDGLADAPPAPAAGNGTVPFRRSRSTPRPCTGTASSTG